LSFFANCGSYRAALTDGDLARLKAKVKVANHVLEDLKSFALASEITGLPHGKT